MSLFNCCIEGGSATTKWIRWFEATDRVTYRVRSSIMEQELNSIPSLPISISTLSISRIEVEIIQGQSRQTVNFDFDIMGAYWNFVLGFIGYKWALEMDISLSEARMLKYQS